MGYREDVAVVFSKEGWKELSLFFATSSNSFTVEQYELVKDFLYSADQHIVDSTSGDRIFLFEYIKTYTDDYCALQSMLNQIDDCKWMTFSLGEDGGSKYGGSYMDNVFCVGSTHSLLYNEDVGDNFSGSPTGLIVPTINANSAPSMPIKVTSVQIVVNDYTCACGNTKCSRTEKACWKCGAAIKE